MRSLFILSGAFHSTTAQANRPGDASGNRAGSLQRSWRQVFPQAPFVQVQGAPDSASLETNLGGLLLSDIITSDSEGPWVPVTLSFSQVKGNLQCDLIKLDVGSSFNTGM